MAIPICKIAKELASEWILLAVLQPRYWKKTMFSVSKNQNTWMSCTFKYTQFEKQDATDSFVDISKPTFY